MRNKLILLVILAIFVIHSLHLDFTQDDAFISFRYIKNFISGHGLVFNPGERVEGYTNFFWIILLSILVRSGLDVILLSKILGILSGAGVLVLVYLISLRYVGKKNWYLAFLPSAFLAANSAFAYWSISGLETCFFALGVLLGVWLYFYDRRLTVLLLAISSLIRPEGVLIFFIFILYQIFGEKEKLKGWGFLLIEYILLLLPYGIFKYFYYGELLPNTFYAKAGISWEHLNSGLEYFFRFLKNYGFWGLGYIIPLYLYRGLDRSLRFLTWVLWGYSFYIILIGGDVLRVHRFFIPVLSLLYLFVAVLINRFLIKLSGKLVLKTTLYSLVILALTFTFVFPREWILNVRFYEKALISKMEFVGMNLKTRFGPDITLAATTIGVLSYVIPGRVIDMLGLCDREISHNPEYIEGVPSSWKERKYNAGYVMSQDPDFVVFSTGIKPSAPAERALYLHSEFRKNYYVFSFVSSTRLVSVFKRKNGYQKEDEIFGSAEFVNLHNQGINLIMRRDYRSALAKFKEVVASGPEDFAWGYEEIGRCYYNLNDYSQSEVYLRKAIELDDHCVTSHFLLGDILLFEKEYKLAWEQYQRGDLYNPGILDKWVNKGDLEKLKRIVEQKEKKGIK